MHRREPDASNAGYWFRRVGEHAVFDELARQARDIGLRLSSERWDPFEFIDLCEQHRGAGTPMELLPTFDANESSLPVALPEKKAHLSVLKKTSKPAKKKSKSGITKRLDEAKNPDASAVFDGGNWQLPSRKDIREILSGLDGE